MYLVILLYENIISPEGEAEGKGCKPRGRLKISVIIREPYRLSSFTLVVATLFHPFQSSRSTSQKFLFTTLFSMFLLTSHGGVAHRTFD